jgi:hypothetical protein
MDIYSYALHLPGPLRVLVQCSRPLFDEPQNKLLAAAYIPGIKFAQAQGEHDLKVSYREGQPLLTVDASGIELSDTFHGHTLLDLIHLIYSACRLQWLKRGLYCVHSACIGAPAPSKLNADKAGDAPAECNPGLSLIVGHSGSGKTTLALSLAEQGQKIFSANKTLLSLDADGIKAIAGTETITRTSSTEAKAQSQAQAQIKLGAHPYLGRSAYLLPEEHYLAGGAGKSNLQVTTIALTRLNDGAEEWEPLSAISALHKLFPFFLDSVNADTVLLHGGDVFSGALPPDQEALVRKTLAAALVSALAKVHAVSVSGSRQFITEKLMRR